MSGAQNETTNSVPGDLAVAALLLVIDHDQAARVVRGLGTEQLLCVTRAMNALRERSVDRHAMQQILMEAVQRVHGGQAALGDVQSHVESVLGRAFGEEFSGSLEGDAERLVARRRFCVFEKVSSADLANVLASEHPQIAAVFLAHLDRAKAADVVGYMPDAKQPDLIYRVATLDRTPHDVVERVLEVMTKKVTDLGLTAKSAAPKAWVKTAAEIVNRLDGVQEPILEEIERVNGDVAGSIREQMFTFDDMASLERKPLQRILARIDTRTLAVALKATTLATEENVFDNLSKRAGEMVREERDLLGPIEMSNVLAAQQRIAALMRGMVERGEIRRIATPGEQLV